MYKYKECMVAQTQKQNKMEEYYAFVYGGNVFIVSSKNRKECEKFEDRFGSPKKSGTFEEMVKYSTDYQEYAK